MVPPPSNNLEPSPTRLQGMDARIKIWAAGVLLLNIALCPPGTWLAPAIPGLIALMVGLFAGVTMRQWLERLIPLIPFVLLLLLLPLLTLLLSHLFSFDGIELSFWSLRSTATRLLSSATVLVLLNCTTSTPDLFNALRALHIPDVMVRTIELLFRYLALLRDEARQLKQAHAARGGDFLAVSSQRRSLGLLVATLLVRTQRRGDRIYDAMLARGVSYARFSSQTSPWPVRESFVTMLFVVLSILLQAMLTYRVGPAITEWAQIVRWESP